MLVAAFPCFVLVITIGFYLLVRDGGNVWFRQLGGGLLLFGLLLALMTIYQHPLTWWFIGLSLVMAVADTWLAQRKTIDLGEAFWPDLRRTLLGAGLMAGLFALPIVIPMVIATGPTVLMNTILLATVTLAIASQIFASSLQRLFDQWAFTRQPTLQVQRATLRETADVLPRNDEAIALLALDEEAFAKLTRRAISNLGDLPRLAASPLTRLPAVDARLATQNQADNTLARAAVLRDLLIESIIWLKPDAGPESTLAFDQSDAWRHYNALYFPYVVGLKPYSRRSIHEERDEAAKVALDWFRSQVPERTLYNWQNAAARLVAQHLREVES